MNRINRSMPTKHLRQPRGAVIADGTAAIVLILPLLILVVFVTIEASKAWCIQQALEHSCREATRALAEEYANEGSFNIVTNAPPAIVTSRTQQNSKVFNNIRINNIVNASAQFGGAADSVDPTWVIPGYNGVAQGTTPTVTVSCLYAGGTNGLPMFPDWDPLHLGKNFKLLGVSTYHLENQ